MAIIDRTLVQRLIQARLDTLQGGGVVDVVMPGEEDPESSPRWVRLVAVDFAAVRGHKPNDPASADAPEHARVAVTLSVFCGVSLMRQSSGALALGVSHVCAALEHQTLRDVATGHQVDLHGAEVRADAPLDGEQPGLAGAGVLIEGQVCRTSGSTLISL